MVILHYKKTELNQFLYETTVEISIDELIKELREERKYYQPGIINNGENKIKMNDHDLTILYGS